MRIGIITFHRALNYGALLQAYALQRVLSEKCNVEILDYRSASIEEKYYICSFKTFIKIICKLILYPRQTICSLRKKHKFKSYYKKVLHISKKKYRKRNIVSANDLYDIFIAGSDQVWNIDITNKDLNYFLKFAEEGKKYSYAASFGNSKIITPSNATIINKELMSFQSILLREESGVKLVKEIAPGFSKEITCVSDPIFLLDKKQWEEQICISTNDEKYIFLFLVADPVNSISVARKLQAQTGYKIKYCHTYGSYYDVPKEFENCMSVGPEEFLALIMNASYVVTTSFHGMAFSIKFQKQFFYELDSSTRSNNSRLENLAELFSLKDRCITDEQLPSCNDINYEEITKKVEAYSCRSKEILFDSIGLK